MQLDVIDTRGMAKEAIDVADSVFDTEFNNALVHQVAVAYRAAARAGTHAQKNRSAVRGGGAKPYRQKGMGRARAGTRSSPLFRSGGQIFAASPRDYSQKVNRKSYRQAMRSVLSELHRLGRLIVVDNLQLDSPKTRNLVDRLSEINCSSALIVTEQVDENLYLATRNIPNVNVIAPSMLNPADAVDCKKLLITVEAVKNIEKWLQ